MKTRTLPSAVLVFAMLAGTMSLSSYVAGDVDRVGISDARRDSQDPNHVVAGKPGSRPVVRLYQGPEKPQKEVFVLVLDPHLSLLAVDGDEVPSSAREYHLLPGLHKLEVNYHEWSEDPPPGYDDLVISWRSAHGEDSVRLPAGHRRFLEYKVVGDEVLFQLAPLGPLELDGRWLGKITCEGCDGCDDEIEERISIDVQNSRFEIALDMGPQGQGLIDERGQMMIRKKGKESFSFFGREKGGSFKLRGRAGSRACRITLHR